MYFSLVDNVPTCIVFLLTFDLSSILPDNKLTLMRNAHITTLNLTGVVVPELPKMERLQNLFLRWVQLTDPHPFRDFATPNLETFVMNNCAGPVTALEYVPLMTGLATAHSLSRLELVRVPFLGEISLEKSSDSSIPESLGSSLSECASTIC